MSDNNEISKPSIIHHLIIESILIIIIIFMLVKCTPDIKVDSQGNVKNIIETISLTKEGKLILSKKNGDVISISDSIDKTNNEDPRLKQLHNITIVATGGNERAIRTKDQISFIDGILSSALADEHKNPDHIYYNLTTRIDGTTTCRRYNITLHWKYVGPCI